jgi:hypothetical protein
VKRDEYQAEAINGCCDHLRPMAGVKDSLARI